MMTHKPDEIKKGLNDPIHVHYHHGDREPHMTPLAMIDLEQLHADALALIQQLQAENAQLNRCIKNMTDKLNAMNDEVAKLQAEIEKYEEAANKCCYESQCNAELNRLEALCKRLKDENEQLQAERDAAVACIPKVCEYCKNNVQLNKLGQTGCKIDSVFPDGCLNGNTRWQWRGAQKEE